MSALEAAGPTVKWGTESIGKVMDRPGYGVRGNVAGSR